ncbi:MAG: hypothetical protein GX091_06005 [Peptococcaceae bacterium]|nr:hypothetical protein [Peptococcaceae bacterium]
MKKIVIKIIRLAIGLFLYPCGIVMTINADLGLSTWDVLHQGISKTTGITMGQASIIVGIAIIITTSFLGERLGWGTLGNIIVIGVLLDFFLYHHVFPTFDSFIPSFIMLIVGIATMGLATYFYMSAELGSGPRDSLMVALKKRSKKSVRFIRFSIESVATFIGFLLGGKVGIGTLVMVVTIGYFIQFFFNLFKFDISKVQHRFIDHDIRALYNYLKHKKDKAKDCSSD